MMNRFFKVRKDDDVPLIKKNPTDSYLFDSDEEEEAEETFKKNDITLWMSDAVILIIEHLQYYAVLLALSEHWGWPMPWVKVTCFTFIFNLDIWEFRKVESGLFDHSRTSFIDSEKLGFNYVSYLAAWAVFLFIISGVFGGVYMRWMRRRPLYLLLYIARWKRIMFIVLQFLTIPFGIVAARIFHCRKNDEMGQKIMDEKDKLIVMDVQNEFQCGEPVQLTLMVLVLIIYVFLFLFYPFILSRWISEQVFSNDSRRHEGYIQLKEAEYEQGLDIQWDIGQYHLFSSFKRAWAYYNPWKFIFKLLFVLAFAFSVRAETVKSLFWSSAAITVLFFMATVALLIRRPFRVKCFNFMIIISHLVLSANALIGNFMVRPPWEDRDKFQIVGFLLQPTITHILITINTSWLILVLLWCAYILLVNNGVFRNERLWPRLSYDDHTNAIGDETKRYMKAALKARRILESALNTIPLFAPIHELSHQVQVINAYCREAEMLKDPTHDTLIDLLDELIEAHNSLAPISVFGLSGKNSIKETSEEFIKLMPSFKKRLRQREYDFILVSPLKRRILLKMYIMSVFIGNIKKRSKPEEDIKTKLQEALALFDTRSLDNFNSLPPSTSGSGGRLTTDEFASSADRDSSMSTYLNNIDDFIGKNTKRGLSGDVLIDRFNNENGGLSTRGVSLRNSPLVGLEEGIEIQDISSPSEQISDVSYRPPSSSGSGGNTKTSSDLSSNVSIPGQVDEEYTNATNNTNTTTV